MHVLKCTSCDLLLHEIPLAPKHNAYCPQCGSPVIHRKFFSFSAEWALSLAALALFFPAQYFALLSINLLGVNLTTTVTSGSLTLMSSYPFVGGLVLFCTTVTPLLFILSIIACNLALSLKRPKMLFFSTSVIEKVKHWVMVDIFLVSLAVACFKIQEYAIITFTPALISFVFLQIILGALLSHVSAKNYWEAYRPSHFHLPQKIATPLNQILTCEHCGLTQERDHQHCVRCNAKLEYRAFQSIQKTWASLITALIFLFPANLYSISVLISNGKKMEDTIFSGVASLIKEDMYGIAIIIFTASIIVPVAKIVSLFYLLICIHLKIKTRKKERMRLYRFVRWIGKWSMMDLCVIAIMVSLIERGNLLDFTPGPGAIAFGLVVIFTMISAESLDSRLIWDKNE